MSGRKLLADALKAALPSWQVVSDARALDSVRKPGACVLWTADREKAPALGLHWFKDAVRLWVLTASDKPSEIEDDLDDLLLQAMEALEPLDAFAYERWERGTLNDVFSGYFTDVTCLFSVTPDN